MHFVNNHRHKGPAVLVATSLVSAVLGSIHAFSVFLAPLEAALGSSRAQVSLSYSLALVCLTATVLLGPRLYSRFAPSVLYLIVAILGSGGAILASQAQTISGVWVGYSLCFGVANGLGYGFGLQLAARANPAHSGWAMGIVTAAYALGAAVAPFGFVRAVGTGGFEAAMMGLAMAVGVASVFAAGLVRLARVRFAETAEHGVSSAFSNRRITGLWLAYGTGVTSGLMVIGHAAGIAEANGSTGWIATALLACFNLIGSLLGGYLSDRMRAGQLLAAFPAMTVAALLLLVLAPQMTLAALGLIGFAYGGTIAAYPSAINRIFPGDNGPRAYGRVFTAWGFAGLFAPWAAGALFDTAGTYAPALWVAAILAMLSGLLAPKVLRAT